MNGKDFDFELRVEKSTFGLFRLCNFLLATLFIRHFPLAQRWKHFSLQATLDAEKIEYTCAAESGHGYVMQIIYLVSAHYLITEANIYQLLGLIIVHY